MTQTVEPTIRDIVDTELLRLIRAARRAEDEEWERQVIEGTSEPPRLVGIVPSGIAMHPKDWRRCGLLIKRLRNGDHDKQPRRKNRVKVHYLGHYL